MPSASDSGWTSSSCFIVCVSFVKPDTWSFALNPRTGNLIVKSFQVPTVLTQAISIENSSRPFSDPFTGNLRCFSSRSIQPTSSGLKSRYRTTALTINQKTIITSAVSFRPFRRGSLKHSHCKCSENFSKSKEVEVLFCVKLILLTVRVLYVTKISSW